ncbi:[alpha-L-fucopyranosyl-(1-_3)-alpha-L-rhamnopyran osyl-(1-_3)-2-O-methyl-alpha-L-rhamnopyranosyl] dimycocerosyl phenol-phthiocerol 2'''-O-methyltransferase [Polynucleobacter sp. HIN10]|nr:[alpha-L-fucopyranosyl-(1->3)-alpha-L-rhamnopyran osyl-(1->3)-2-O-methyl-alpha-L-rhamnopyranosyl] dimycocerosyl phenol-phthiocerol 2'''-O-methyltransferase [Polynucleobacter sp. HIN10]BEI43931.1 [alpha-L-fucopyranosyl-(1->3)-alpha-L-rhamnopyran osyl-(1->3)-2-O-methyl-alpha-L-rhamnopyranosyl] dimycocerosyl phenol-phthiocerol 2'''-O-methyltransferase [Polynucleobacter sp. HIN11]
MGSEHKTLLKRKFNTIVDIGANRGQFSLAANKWSPNAKIYAFEPLPIPASIFNKIFSNHANTILNSVAIGPSIAKTYMHVSARDDSSSLLEIDDPQVEIFPGTNMFELQEVNVGRLDQFLTSDDFQSPSLLKIDVQGYEFEVLVGCESLLTNIDVIYCECSFIELYKNQKLAFTVIEWLLKREFIFNGFYNSYYDKNGRTVQADFVFIKK